MIKLESCICTNNKMFEKKPDWNQLLCIECSIRLQGAWYKYRVINRICSQIVKIQIKQKIYDILIYLLHKAQDGEKKNYRKFIQKFLMQDGNQQLKPNKRKPIKVNLIL